MKKLLLSVTVFALAGFGFAQAPCTDLFFSEYIEGTGSNKAIEVYNPTPNSVDLSNYHIFKYLNGGTTPNDTLWMSGMLAPGATYNIVDPDSITDLGLVALADTLHTVTFFNGDDPLYLFHLTVLIDVIGEAAGVDPGVNWVVGAGATSEFTLIRKPNIFAGTTSWTVGATQWDVMAQNDFTDFGMHTMDPCSTAAIVDEIPFEISLFPNPTTGHLNVMSETNDYSIQVFDLTGKTVVNRIHLSQNTNVDLSSLSNGIYMVKLNDGTTQLTKKIIVRK